MSAMFYDGSQLYLYSNIIQIGSAILAVGMIFYGVIIHRHHLLPRLNWLPLAVGLTELLSVVASFSDADPLKFAILVYATSLVATTAWILLGIALWPRGDEEVPAQNVSTPVEPAI